MILGAIITYNPSIKRLKKNVQSIMNQVDNILLIDNNSSNVSEIEKLCFENEFMLLKNNENKGIAEALNQALEVAREINYEYIITLDQDSISETSMVSNLREGFKNKTDIAIISPSIFDLNTKQIMTKKILKNYEEIEWAITSGSLCKVEFLINVSGFDSKLFIDYVDTEICLRLRKNNYKILLSKQAILNHEVGKMQIKNIFGIKFNVTNHSAFRYYYIFRNSIYVNNKYNNKNFKRWIKENLKLFKKLLGILIWEEKKKEKLVEIFRGIKDTFKVGDFK